MNIIECINIMFSLPITRRKILRYALKKLKKPNKEDYSGICMLLHHTLSELNIDSAPKRVFPLLKYENAIQFGAVVDATFWWYPHDWASGRMEFLKWLYEQYKSDKTNIRKLCITTKENK